MTIVAQNKFKHTHTRTQSHTHNHTHTFTQTHTVRVNVFVSFIPKTGAGQTQEVSQNRQTEPDRGQETDHQSEKTAWGSARQNKQSRDARVDAVDS